MSVARLLVGVFFLLILTGPAARAEFTSGLIDVDLTFVYVPNPPTQTGPVVIGAVGDIWNAIRSGNSTTGVLALSNGTTSSGVTLSITGATGIIAGGTP